MCFYVRIRHKKPSIIKRFERKIDKRTNSNKFRIVFEQYKFVWFGWEKFGGSQKVNYLKLYRENISVSNKGYFLKFQNTEFKKNQGKWLTELFWLVNLINQLILIVTSDLLELIEFRFI